MAAVKENLMDAINDLAQEKGIERGDLVQIVEDSVAAAARKKLTKYNSIEAELNQKTGEVELFQYKKVAQFAIDPENEISLEEAQAMDESAEEGDEVEYEIDAREFNRIAQTTRQFIFKKIKDAEREIIFSTFSERKGEILTGTVIRTEHGGHIAINFNRTEAYLFRREQIPGERFDQGDHIRVFLMDVSNDPKYPSQLMISRTHPGFLMKLFEMEVPEVYDGIVEVVNASREPGRRAKVAVYTTDGDIDPVGACVGLRGSRVQSIVNELRGEKIDIVRWNEDLPTYLEYAMAPAEIARMGIDEEQREINIWVEQDQLSLAIGKKGQNVRLASKLLGYKINVTSLDEGPSISIEDQIALELEKERFSEGNTQPENQTETVESQAIPATGGVVAKEETPRETSGEPTGGEEAANVESEQLRTPQATPEPIPVEEASSGKEAGSETAGEPISSRESAPGEDPHSKTTVLSIDDQVSEEVGTMNQSEFQAEEEDPVTAEKHESESSPN